LFPAMGMTVIDTDRAAPDNQVVMFNGATAAIALEPGKSTQVDLALFVGPRDTALFSTQPYKALGFSDLIVYNLGGCCSFITFQPLAKGLLFLLKGIYFVVRDWGVAIIILVVIVRALLHPITRRSQISMTRMQKQMAALQPEIDKLKKKYKDDPARLQQEQTKLWREKQVNPMNMLGCLPMFLQTPIWIALYAMLYFAIELRHQPAFYGVFQLIPGWRFLGDLSSQDFFIKFAGNGFTIPLLGWGVHGINIIPILMAGLFWVQQKYTTAPPANEQAAQQQKMMSYMSFIFPLMLYNTPSGLTLYIMASTGAGIVDSYIIKRHIREQEAKGTFLPAESRPKKEGFFSRMMKKVEDEQRLRGREK
jgi:YidC/Oxa1 family membrane protein insertase